MTRGVAVLAKRLRGRSRYRSDAQGGPIPAQGYDLLELEFAPDERREVALELELLVDWRTRLGQTHVVK
jgi:hypothetical protein